MDNENSSMKTKQFILFIAIFLSLANISAFAVSSQYWEENPLKMQPGETKEIKIMLQNLAGDSDISALATITQSSEIAKISSQNSTYKINAGEKSEVTVQIEIPKKGYKEEYNLIISFKTSEEGEGSFELGNSIERQIPIKIQSDKQPINEKLTLGIILLLTTALIILTILLIKKKK